MSHYRFRFSTVLAVSVLSLSPLSAYAQVTYDNGAPNGNGSFGMTRNAVADDFLVSSSLTFDSIRFFAVDQAQGLSDNFSGTLSWWVHADNGAARPGAVILSGVTSDVTVTDTGRILQATPSMQIGQYDFGTGARTLSAGNYWLRIAEGIPSSSTDQTDIFWVTTQEQHGNPVVSAGQIDNPSASSYAPTSSQFAFQFRRQVTSAVAPEPPAVLLIALAFPLAGSAICRRYHARKHYGGSAWPGGDPV